MQAEPGCKEILADKVGVSVLVTPALGFGLNVKLVGTAGMVSNWVFIAISVV